MTLTLQDFDLEQLGALTHGLTTLRDKAERCRAGGLYSEAELADYDARIVANMIGLTRSQVGADASNVPRNTGVPQ